MTALVTPSYPLMEVHRLQVSNAQQTVISDLELDVAQGSLLCLLGPSGCGKSTLLRTIAGFQTPEAGTIRLAGKLLTQASFTLAPQKRQIGMVFQDVALFPHLTVAANIGFGLQRWSKTEAQGRVETLLNLVGLAGFGERYPHELSGGQQRRVAMARAIAPKPRVLLMDEPFTGLDAALRETLAPEIAKVLRQENITSIMVTHDQREAFVFADQVALMNEGSIEQVSSAYDIYHNPKTRFVAEFIGEGDFLHGKLRGDALDFSLGQIPLSTSQIAQFADLPDKIDVFIRPDDILHDDLSPIHGRILSRRFRGTHFLYRIELPSGERIACFADSHHDHQVGQNLGISLNLHHLLLFGPETREPSHGLSSVRSLG